MRRTFKEFVSPRAISNIRYIPACIFVIKNWYRFLLNYLGSADSSEVYYLRNGLRIKTGDGVGAAIIFGIFLKKEYGAAPPGESTVIDIGAHVGVYSLYASQSQGTRVYAYEPVPANFTLLQDNIKQNHLEQRVFPFPFAAAGVSGRMRMYLRPEESGLHSFLPIGQASFQTAYREKQNRERPSIEVPCVSLKDIFDTHHIQHCDMLKIDCEGSEYDILYALGPEYFRRIKYIRLEYHNHSGDRKYTGDGLLGFLEQQGFSIQHVAALPHQGTVWLKNKNS